MFSIVYASSATTHFSPAQLAGLLAQCREHNSAADVTGMLLYKHGNFMQVLEGEEETVRALFTKISGTLATWVCLRFWLRHCRSDNSRIGPWVFVI